MIYLESVEVTPPQEGGVSNAAQPGWQPYFVHSPYRTGKLTLTFELSPDCNAAAIKLLFSKLRGIPHAQQLAGLFEEDNVKTH